MSDELRKKLAQTEGQIRELRDERAGQQKKLEAAKEAYGENSDESREAELFDAAKEARRAVGDTDDALIALNEKSKELLRLLGDKESVARKEKPANPLQAEGLLGASGWDSSSLLADENVKARLEHISNSKSRFGSLQLGQVLDRDALVAALQSGGMYAADIAPSGEMRRGTYRGILPQLRRPLTVLNLIPTGTTDGNSVPYTQEGGALTGAAETAEGDQKPEAGVTFTDATADVETIAAWMKTRKQALADFPALRATIDSRLRYLVERRVEGQVIAGDGTGSNLTGILNTAGIGTVDYDASVPTSELVLSGITNIYLQEGVADGVVLNPVEWMNVLTEKADNGTYGSLEYRGGGPFAVTPQSIWGVQAIPSAAVASGRALVGDFALGAQLLIREGINVLFSDSDQDDFIRNRVTLLGEMRAALLVWRPSVFQDVDLAA